MSCCPDPAGALALAGPSCGGFAEAHDADLRASAMKLGSGLFQSEFILPEMHCAGCIRTLEADLSALEGVDHVRANLSQRRVSVTWDPALTSPSKIEKTLRNLGFSPRAFDGGQVGRHDDATGRALVLSLAVAGFAAMNIMLLSVSVWSGADEATAGLFHLISGLIAVPAVLYAGRPFYQSAWHALRAGRLNMDVPISLAVGLALAMSLSQSLNGGHEVYFDAAVMLLFFLLIGRTLDHMMRRRALSAVERLATLAPRGAMVVMPSGEASKGPHAETVYTPVGLLEPGMILRITAGERLPVDVAIIAGSADFDRSMVTGESTPVTCHAADTVEAGAINLSGSIDVQVLRPADRSFIAEIMKLMAAAEGSRSRYVRIADRMAALYAPMVHLLALATFLGWILASGGDWHLAFTSAIAVLIITCPCALGLAVPVVHVVAATRLFREGILMKDGSALERLAEVSAVFFDKTGTLTNACPVTGTISGNPALRTIAASLAAHSQHPASRAVAIMLDGMKRHAVSNVREVAGAGIEGVIGGRVYRLGRIDWALEGLGSHLPFEKSAALACGGSSGTDPLFFEISETPRVDALSAIGALKVLGLKLAILSGDRSDRVAAMARKLGVACFHAEASPTEKVDLIEERARAGEKVLMVGDGLNDAAALSHGHASMAPASACDIGRLAADFVFTREQLGAVPFAIRLARAAAGLVRQNFALALVYNLFAVPLAMAGIVTPLIAAIAMSASSILVVLNSMRLNRMRFGMGSVSSAFERDLPLMRALTMRGEPSLSQPSGEKS